MTRSCREGAGSGPAATVAENERVVALSSGWAVSPGGGAVRTRRDPVPGAMRRMTSRGSHQVKYRAGSGDSRWTPSGTWAGMER